MTTAERVWTGWLERRDLPLARALLYARGFRAFHARKVYNDGWFAGYWLYATTPEATGRRIFQTPADVDAALADGEETA